MWEQYLGMRICRSRSFNHKEKTDEPQYDG
jgi:hypothetical protein